MNTQAQTRGLVSHSDTEHAAPCLFVKSVQQVNSQSLAASTPRLSPKQIHPPGSPLMIFLPSVEHNKCQTLQAGCLGNPSAILVKKEETVKIYPSSYANEAQKLKESFKKLVK